MRALLALVCVGSLGLGLVMTACGGATAGDLASGDSGAAASSGEPAGSDDAGSGTTVSSAPCDPPADPTKAALCLTVLPEAIAFTSDERFDGKGYLVAQVFDVAQPDSPDGGEVPALAAQEIGAPDASTVDLSQPLSTIRFDGLPARIYPRVVFFDDPQTTAIAAGSWLGGYDLQNGLDNSPPLVAESLVAGAGTSITMRLTALRELVVTMQRTVAPAGNGQGPAVFIATPDQVPASNSHLFGLGQSACSDVGGTGGAQISGFVMGPGPYYVAAVLDDFGPVDSGISLPPGALTSLAYAGGALQIPMADELTYAATAYRVSQTLALEYAVPGAPATDGVSCP